VFWRIAFSIRQLLDKGNTGADGTKIAAIVLNYEIKIPQAREFSGTVEVWKKLRSRKKILDNA
jgi:hypothetical protein